MSINPISQVLALLRLMKAGGLKKRPSDLLALWADQKNLTPSSMAKVSAYLCDNLEVARYFISQSNLDSEQKAGPLNTINLLSNTFAYSALHSAHSPWQARIDSDISQFSVLSMMLGLPKEAQSPPELADLIADVENIRQQFSDADIDPLVRDTAQKHIDILLCLLKNAQTFGIDAAKAAYAELVVRLLGAVRSSKSGPTPKVMTIWAEIERWSGRLAIIDQAWTHGANLLSKFESVPAIMHQLAGIAGTS